jgi:TRAP-type C4-dicarboxylate transport system permease small subunit
MNGRGESASAADRWLAAGDAAVARVENALNAFAGICIFALMLLVVVEVIGRRLFRFPIPGHIDWVELGMITFALLGVAYCQRLGGHVRMELLVSRMRGRAMWLLETFSIAVALFVIGFLVVGSWRHFERAWTIGDTTIDVQLQTWPSKLVVPVALGLLWLRLLLQLWGYLRLARDPGAPVLAVPVTLGLHEQAKQQIEEATGDGTAET